jgi:hypothetical protein
MIGGILFYGVGQAKGWAIWRIIYMLCGGLTVSWGIVLWFFLPDSIFTAKRFSVEERTMLIARTLANQTGTLNRTIKKSQIFEVFRDAQIWLLFAFVLLNAVINGGIAGFASLIVKGFVKDPLLTTAYGVPWGAINAVFNFTGPWMASRYPNVRTYVMIAWLVPTLIATCLFWQLPRSNHGGLLAGYYLVRTQPRYLVHGLVTDRATLSPVRLLRWKYGRCTPDARQQRGRLHEACHSHRLRLSCVLCGQHLWTTGLRWERSSHLPVGLHNYGSVLRRTGHNRCVSTPSAHQAQQGSRCCSSVSRPEPR